MSYWLNLKSNRMCTVLIPLDEEETADEDEDIEVIILKVVHDEEGNEFLSDIEDDEEWERVADAWQELVESEDLY